MRVEKKIFCSSALPVSPPPTSLMFKTFKVDDDFGTATLAKSSVVRTIRVQIVESFPPIEPYIDDILPKKITLTIVKGKNDFAFCNFVVADGKILFYQLSDKAPWLPTLRLLHRFPDMMPKMQVDKGAIKFVLRGANIMAPGLTSAGGMYQRGLLKSSPVQVTAEGCQHACAIGNMLIDSNDLDNKPTGLAIESIHTLGDGVWKSG